MNARRSNVMGIPVERSSSIFEKVQGSSSLGLRHMRPPLSRAYFSDRERTLIEPEVATSEVNDSQLHDQATQPQRRCIGRFL